jgi:glycosyltransferase involved in cell wall biosynthesis
MGCHDRVQLVWNANNTFGFHRVPFAELRRVAVMTTVSRYMKHVMWDYGVDPWVIANGIPERWLEPVPRVDCARLARLFAGRTTLAKVARWDPDKRWAMCVDAVALMKGQGLRPLLIARGGVEEHGREILARARGLGLRIATARWSGADLTALEEAMAPAVRADMVVLQDYVSEEQRRVLFRTADAVVANSGIEPFGLVGLETMAVGGIALVGCTGEDYATPGHDSIALQTSDPREILQCAFRLRSGDTAFRLRRAARRSAALYTWPAVITRTLPRFLEVQGIPRMQVPAGGIHPGTAGETSEPREAPARVVAAPR